MRVPTKRVLVAPLPAGEGLGFWYWPGSGDEIAPKFNDETLANVAVFRRGPDFVVTEEERHGGKLSDAVLKHLRTIQDEGWLVQRVDLELRDDGIVSKIWQEARRTSL